MDWTSVINDPLLQNLPYKIELNEHGTIMMSPASNKHGNLQMHIGLQLSRVSGGSGDIVSECSVQTRKGVKVADVAWLSDNFLSQHGFLTPYTVAPEICVEIVSPSNSNAEMQQKIELYLESGAAEVWLCNENGEIRFFSDAGEIEKSGIFEKFPNQI